MHADTYLGDGPAAAEPGMGTDGTITWTTTTGQHHTHGPEPLPGHATGEAYWQPHTQVTTRPAA